MNRPLRFTALLLPALLLACGGDAQVSETGASAAPAPPVTETNAASGDATDPGGTFTPPALTPSTVSPEAPIPVTQLRDAILAAYGQTATVYGYVHDPFRDTETLRGTVGLAAAPGQKGMETQLVECTFATAPNREVSKDDVIVVRGTVGAPMTAGARYMRLDDCTLVGVGEAPAGALSVQALYDAMLGWVGREVAVTGRYNGTTTSQLASGPHTAVRLEAPGTEGLTGEVASCVMADEVPAAVTERPDGVVLRGTVTDGWNLSRRTVTLEGCTFVDR